MVDAGGCRPGHDCGASPRVQCLSEREAKAGGVRLAPPAPVLLGLRERLDLLAPKREAPETRDPMGLRDQLALPENPASPVPTASLETREHLESR